VDLILKKTFLENFRNYQKLILNFGNGVNIIWGRNPSGKTNILEAMFFLGQPSPIEQQPLKI